MGDADDSYDFSHLTRFLRSSGTVTTSSWAILLAAGFGGALYSLARWSATGFGPLDPRVMLRAAIPAAAAMCLGGEVVLTSFFARRAWSSFGRDRLFAMFTLCLVVANGVICGILSGPYHRYQARIVWLVPVAALVVEGGCGWLTGRFAERPVRSVSTAPTRSPTGAACAPESGRRRPAAAS